jgi:hypothetical protein
MDDLIATLELAEIAADSAQDIQTEPPVILFYPEPAILITIDGEPHLVASDEQNVQRVINTPYTILRDQSSGTYFLFADKDTWYSATSINGDWQITSKVPVSIASQAPAEEEPDEDEWVAEGEQELEPGPPPRVIVATEPTELISSNGKPEYKPVSGTELLTIGNTDSDVLLDTKTQQHYVLLSGRWYASKSLNGPWSYVASEDLPEDFAKIPEDSEMGTVLYAVAGTDVARDAVMDAQIPQTAAVDKKKASLTVEYDGQPQVELIEGTDMHWVVNTATPVIQVGNTWYALDEAVWFVSSSATGPWAVATSVPGEIYTIPASSPIYNVTFVRIYGSDDDVVYVGYTPGYTNTYVYNTTIVYGSGYYWPGWYGRFYYPRYASWGFHVRWNPWTGWGFGFSYGYGPFRFYVGGGPWFRVGWFGPARFVGYRHGYRRGYRHGMRAGYRAGYRAGQRHNTRQNVYNSNRNKARTTPASAGTRNNTRPNTVGNRAKAGAATGARPNNVYADRNGNIHRQTDKGWEQRSGNSWKTTEGRQQAVQQQSRQPSAQQRSQQQRSQPSSSQYNQRTSSNRTSTSDLNRSSSARQRGYQNSSNYRRSSSAGRSRPARRR